mgnify:CR=1 FL=1
MKTITRQPRVTARQRVMRVLTSLSCFRRAKDTARVEPIYVTSTYSLVELSEMVVRADGRGLRVPELLALFEDQPKNWHRNAEQVVFKALYFIAFRARENHSLYGQFELFSSAVRLLQAAKGNEHADRYVYYLEETGGCPFSRRF